MRLGSIAPLFAGLLVGSSPAFGQVANLPDRQYFTRYSPDGKHFYLAEYRFVNESEVKIDGLKISTDRLAGGHFPLWWASTADGTPPDVRAALQSSGYVYQGDKPPPPAPKPTADEGLQDHSEPGSLAGGMGNQADAPLPSGPTFFARAFNYLRDHIVILLAILSLPLMGWIAKICRKALWDWRHRRSVEMIYCGLPSSGKTALIARLRHPDLPESHFDEHDTTRKLDDKKRHDPISKSGLEFHPTSVDIPGSKPSLFLERLLVPKKRFGRRIVLVVLAPFDKPDAENHISEKFVQNQSGYIFGLVETVVTSTKLPKPDLVVAFMNKSDLFVGREKELAAAFQPDIDRIALTCKGRGVKLLRVKGSARTGAGTKGMMDSIIEHLGA
ncbi:MAG: GTPase domain-containing protein [Sphingomonas sp.]